MKEPHGFVFLSRFSVHKNKSARGGTRTHMRLLSVDFKSTAYADSATLAKSAGPGTIFSGRKIQLSYSIYSIESRKSLNPLKQRKKLFTVRNLIQDFLCSFQIN